MYSVEWLVDHSDTIVIVRDPTNPDEGNPKVLKCIKGDATSLTWPLTPVKTRWPDYKNCVPPSEGPIRLLFVRGQSELLQAVKLGRDRTVFPIDWLKRKSTDRLATIYGINRTLFGVTQFGDLLLTESSFHTAINDRLKTVRIPVKARMNPYGVHEVDSEYLGMLGGTKFACSHSTTDFPLATTDEFYSIVVPFDTYRRDYYFKRLKHGVVLEKIYAINQLAAMMDTVAHAAVRAAVQSDEVELSSEENGATKEIGPWNSVHFAAVTALEIIDKHRDQIIERLASPQATDKIDAINDLALFNDPFAVDAIRQATQIATAVPYINVDKGTRIDVQTVRETAVKALEQIEGHGVQGTKSRR